MRANELRDIYWNNYCRKLVTYGMDSPRTLHAKRLYDYYMEAYYASKGVAQ